MKPITPIAWRRRLLRVEPPEVQLLTTLLREVRALARPGSPTIEFEDPVLVGGAYVSRIKGWRVEWDKPLSSSGSAESGSPA